MKSVRFCLLLLSVHLVREGDGMITGPRSRRELGQVEPRTIEVEAGEELSELLEKEAEPERRYVHMWSSFWEPCCCNSVCTLARLLLVRQEWSTGNAASMRLSLSSPP